MGSIVIASCKCGFRSEELFVGHGFVGAGDTYMEPALCPGCRSFGVRDRRHPPQKCRRCGREMVFYGDRDFALKYFVDPLRAVPVREDVAEGLSDRHICPQCGEPSLSFEKIGDWE